MWKFAATVIERFSGLTPMKAFLKYIFQRLSNDFLDHQPNIDFKKGQLELLDLPLSAQKINQTFLMSSPYILHSGIIRKLKISLPNLLEITSKSIEVQLSGLQLVFYPNKRFLQRFNEKMKQMKMQSKFYQEQDVVREAIQFKEDDSLDFFKQIIKQILTNIKVNVNNISIKLFMNTPSSNLKDPKPQFYTMLRIPLILAERSKEEESTQSQEIQRYILKIPQISTHLLREDQQKFEYYNTKTQNQSLSRTYPSANHPSTLMLIGNQNLESDAQSVQISLTIKKQLKTKIKKYSVKGSIPNIQFMVEPFQIKVLEKFLSQLEEFRKLFSYSIQQLRKEDPQLYKQMADVSREFSVKDSVRLSSDFQSSMDIFSSIAMAFEDRQPKQRRKQLSYFDSIMQQNNKNLNELKANLGQFNRLVSQQDKQKIRKQRDTKFNTILKTNVDIGMIRVYILKHNTSNSLIQYQRIWTVYDKNKPILLNEHIPCSYFMLNIKQTNVELEDHERIEISIKKVALLNIKLSQSKQSENSLRQSDIFHSFQNISVGSFSDNLRQSQQQKDTKPDTNGFSSKSLLKFEKSHHQHFCANYIFWISIKDPSKIKKRLSGFSHCLMPEVQKKEDNIFSFRSDKIQSKDIFIQKFFSINLKLSKPGTKESKASLMVERVGLVIDFQIAKDLINIIYPLFTYRRMMENINLKKQEIDAVLKQSSGRQSNYKTDLSFSSYDLSVVPEAYVIPESNSISSKSKSLIEVSICSISVGLIDLSLLDSDLVGLQKSKMKDSQSFSSVCFCQYSHECINIQINKLKVRSQQRIKVFFKDSYIWLKAIHNQKPVEKTLIIGFPNQTSNNRIFIDTLKNNSEIERRVSVHLPHLKINIEKKQCIKAIRMVQKIGGSYKILRQYWKHLHYEFKRMQSRYNIQNKSKKQISKLIQTSIILHLQNLQASIFDAELYISDLFFFKEIKQTTLKLNNLLLIHLHKAEPLLKSVPIDTKVTIKNIKKQINASSVILRMNNKQKEIEPFTNQTKDREFFKKLQNFNFSFVLQISQCQDKLGQNNKITDLKNSGKFGFAKRKQLEIISQQEDQQVINFTILQSIIIRPCELKNVLLLKEDIEQIQSFISSSKITEIFTQDAPIKKRKDSDWAPQRKIRVNFKIKQLALDVFPYDDLKQSSTILSSTRSYVSLENILIQIQSSEKASQFGEHMNSNMVNIEIKKTEVYFIYFNDTEVSKNPLLIPKNELINYGFKLICSLNSFSSSILHELSLWTKETLLELAFKVDSIDGECSTMTTVYLQYHIDTLVRMIDSMFPKKYQPSNRNKLEEVKQQIGSDDEAIDIAQLGQSLRREQQIRSLQENQFKNRTTDFLLNVPENLLKSIILKNLQVKKISFSIFSGDDYDFLESNEKPITQNTIIQLDDKYEVVIRQEVPQGTKETRKRFRRRDVDKYTNIRFVAESMCLEMTKYREKNKQESQTNLRAVFKVRNINWIVNKGLDGIFYLLKIPQKLSIVFEVSGTKIKAKHFFPESIHAGYTSNVDFLFKQREQAQSHLMKMAYLIPIEECEQLDINFKETVYEILVLIPKTKLILTLQMIGFKFLKNQQISTLELFFHNKLSKDMEKDNTSVIKNWITDTLTNNMGSILSHTFITLFSNAIWFFLSCIKHIIIFPGKVFRVLKKGN